MTVTGGLPACSDMADWSLTSLQVNLVKVGVRVVRHARATTFQLAEVAVTGAMVRAILAAIHRTGAAVKCVISHLAKTVSKGLRRIELSHDPGLEGLDGLLLGVFGAMRDEESIAVQCQG